IAIEDDALDRSRLLAIVSHGATVATDPKQARTYAKLQHALRKQNRHGLVEDYPVLGKISQACSKTLTGDAALSAALDAALDAGQAALAADDTVLVAFVDVLGPGKIQSRVVALTGKARAKAAAAAARRGSGDRAGTTSLARAAAARFDAALKI